MKDILFARPADDSAAIQVAVWGQAVRQRAGRFKTDDLSGSGATRMNVDSQLAAGFRHLFWFGHGTEKELIANGKALVDLKNVANLKGGMLVAIACYAGVTLGKVAGTTPGLRVFLGFDDELGFPASAVLPMMLAVTRGLSCMFQKGHDISCAAQNLRKQFDVARLDYKNNGARYGLSAGDARTAWLFAKSNRYSVVTFGDDTTTL
jgi:hypothetical protein